MKHTNSNSPRNSSIHYEKKEYFENNPGGICVRQLEYLSLDNRVDDSVCTIKLSLIKPDFTRTRRGWSDDRHAITTKLKLNCDQMKTEEWGYHKEVLQLWKG